MKNKIMTSGSVISKIKSSDVIMVGGFGLIGSPLTMINELIYHEIEELTIISNNVGEQGKGLGILLQQGKISKAIGSYFTSNRDVAELYNAGKLEVALLPQGTLAEAIRSGGAGILGFYTKTGVGTKLAEGKSTKWINGTEGLFQESLTADIAIIKAHRADKAGNLTYYKTARNFNPDMATAAKFVIAEVDEIVEIGELNPDEVITPHLFVDAIIKSEYRLSMDGEIKRVKTV